MQRRENYLYVGIDLHKRTHTAVMINCWNEKLDVIEIENKPSEFKKLAEKVNRKANQLGLKPIYGLENAYGYGTQTVFEPNVFYPCIFLKNEPFAVICRSTDKSLTPIYLSFYENEPILFLKARIRVSVEEIFIQ